ncbi:MULTISPECIES: DUF3618 domain-containing protein [Mumia]|uniref:DUF3618 domain-containing protein n=1 Tax=Mumia TaxID=1546255 RepID=UPI00141D9BDB|nr:MULTISPECIES: DUF3618 domain-containing protein [unclassified Mumia]QMW66921.1 DUF3618 domain-containing protein [Mumia sp. ZJ1417]
MSTDPTDPSEIQRDIEETRDKLGHTVEELTDRLDVKKQAQQRMDEAKHEAQQRMEYVKQNARDNPQLPAIVAVGVIALIVLALWRKKRH